MDKCWTLYLFLLAFSTSVTAGRIGFHARLSPSTEISVGETIRFSNILLNQNGGTAFGYKPSTGHFACPVSGTYSFSTHLMTRGNKMEFNMKKNEQTIMLLLLDGADGRWKTDGGTVDIQCERGENVYVVGHHSGPVTLHHFWSWFSGHLVAAN